MIYPDEIPIGIAGPLIVLLWAWLIIAAVRWLHAPTRPKVECLACGKQSGELADLDACREWIEIHVLADHPGTVEARVDWPMR